MKVKRTCFWDLTKIKRMVLSGDKLDLNVENQVTQSEIFLSLLLPLKIFLACQTLKKKTSGMRMVTPFMFRHSLQLLAQLLALQKMELQ